MRGLPDFLLVTMPETDPFSCPKRQNDRQNMYAISLYGNCLIMIIIERVRLKEN